MTYGVTLACPIPCYKHVNCSPQYSVENVYVVRPPIIIEDGYGGVTIFNDRRNDSSDRRKS